MKVSCSIRFFCNIQILFLLAAIISCRQDRDNLPPVIDIEKPWENQQVAPGDTILVKAEITDDELITNVTVQLVDGEGVARGPALEKQVNQVSFELHTNYVIPADLEYDTGFQLLIRAYDETEYKNKYRDLIMLFPPLKYRGVLVVTQAGMNQKKVYNLDSVSLTPVHILDAPGDSGASLIWNDRKLVISGSIDGDMLVYDLMDTSLQWYVPALSSPPFRFFTGLCTGVDRLWVGFEEGFISGYVSIGLKEVQTTMSAAFVPERFARTGDVIVGYWDDRHNSGGRIYWHYVSSGAVKQYRSFPDDATEIVPDGNGSFFVLGNGNNGGKVWEEGQGGMVLLHDLGPGELLTGIRLNNGDFVVSMENGIYHIDAFSGSMTMIDAAANLNLMAYDESRSVIIAAGGTHLLHYHLTTGSKIHRTLPHPATGIHPWYGR